MIREPEVNIDCDHDTCAKEPAFRSTKDTILDVQTEMMMVMMIKLVVDDFCPKMDDNFLSANPECDRNTLDK
jgi:fructose-bisphosphate aldolase class 1